MSKNNLLDTLTGLQTFHPNSPYVARVEDELKTRSDEAPVYVEHQAHESMKYEYSEDIAPCSNNPLVDALERNVPIWQYHALAALSRMTNLNQYPLHHP